MVATLTVSLAVASASSALAADGPSVGLPTVSPVAVTAVGQGSRGTEKDEAAQSARRGDQAGLPTTLPGEGSYTATSLSQAGKWDVAGQTGDFSWSYPLKVPPAAGGLEPSMGLGYSSSAVDGLTSASNNQASWVGDGWSLWPGFVERTYGGCQTDLPGDPRNNPADLCWKSDNATLSLNGSATALIRDDVTGVWKPKSDNGSRIERATGPGHNSDNDGEYWKVTTTDGTQYFFGYRPDAGSTWTVPVYGDDAGEPCHKANDFAGSSCVQGYRWQVDKVVSTNGDVMIYNYGTETNKYGQNKNTRLGEYVRGGWLKNIEYGLRDDTPGLAASGRVVFDVTERCLPEATKCDPNNADHKANFPDVPLELKCDGPKCDKTWSPSFWTTKRLHKIRTEVRDGDGYRAVDSWELRHQFPYPGDTGKPALWLAGITHTGHDGGDLALPEVTFEGVRKPNRVVKDGDGHAHLIRFRIGAVVSESGAVTSVDYAAPDCDKNTTIDAKTNRLRCYPMKWSMPASAERTDLFHKYVVKSVSNTDWIGSGASSQTDYDYGVNSAAWHYDESEFTRDEDKTYNQFRGFGKVTVRTGIDPDPRKRTKKVSTYYRGMNGDKDKPDPVRVTDSEGGSELDHNWLAGQTRETVTYLGDTDQIVDKTITEPYWREQPTAKRGPYEARIVRGGTTRSFVMLAGGGKRETKARSRYNEADPTAMVERLDDFGDVAKNDDNQCVTTKYARDTEKWLMTLVSEVDTVAVACDDLATAQFPRDAISNVRTTYDDRGNVTSTQALKERPAADRFEHVTTSRILEVDRHGRVRRTADALGKVSTSEYTPALGGPLTKTKSTDPIGFGVTATLNPARGTTVHSIDSNQRVAEAELDPLGRLTQAWLPGRQRDGDNGNTKFSYKISRTEPNVVTTETLGPRGNYLRSNEILDGQLRSRQTQRQTDEGRLVTDVRYDTHGRAFHKTSAFFTGGTIDDKLWVPSNTEALPPHTITEFDGAGRVTAEIFKAPTEKWRSTTTYGGDWTKVTPPPGGTPITTVVDARGQVTERRTDAPFATYDATTYRYTAAGQLSEVKDPENNTWKNEYDLLGRLTVQHDPDKGVSTKTYDVMNRLIESKDALGTVLRTTYDDIGRPKLKEQVFKDRPAEKRAEWTYDTVGEYGKGLPASVTRWVGNTAYTNTVLAYDRAGRPVGDQLVIPASEPGIAGTYVSTKRYNPDGSLQSTSLPAIGVKGTPGALGAETVLHEYDDLGRPTTTTGGPANKGAFTYVSDTIYTKYGEQQRVQLGPDGKHTWVTTMYEADTRRPNRTVVDTQTARPVQKADINHTYNAAGLITSIVDQTMEQVPDVQCFSYDHLKRLTSAWTPAKTEQPCAAPPSSGGLTGPAPYWQSFSYDKVGNRLTDTQHSAKGDTVRSYGKGDGHKLKSVSTTKPGLAKAAVDEPIYDAAGNTINRRSPSGAAQKLDWDAEGHLAKVTEGDKVTEFLYGPTGDRLIRRDPAGTTVYLNGQELHVKGATATATRYYSHGGQVVATRSGDRFTYVTTDHQGTMNTSIEVSTLKAERRRQLPFGGPRGTETAFAGDRGFVGGTVDAAAGFTTLGARQYDADTGRFLSVDPVADPANAQQLHGYTYSNNSPISSSDPTGLIPGDRPCGDMCDPPGQAPKQPVSANPTPANPAKTPPPSRVRPLPKNATPAMELAWAKAIFTQQVWRETCPSDFKYRTMQETIGCGNASFAFSKANEDYENLLAKATDPGKPSFWDKALGVALEVGDVVKCGANAMIPGYINACFLPSGMNFTQCAGIAVSAGVGASGDACIGIDDRGVGFVTKGDVKLDYHVGAEVTGAGRVSNGDLDNFATANPRTFESKLNKRLDMEVGIDEDELKLHSLGVTTGLGGREGIAMSKELGLPQKEFWSGNQVTRIADTGPLCRYCQAFSNWVISPFR